MIFKKTFPDQMKMNFLENTFRTLYRQHPERGLDHPHPLEYCRDILKQAALKTGSSFPEKLLHSSLEEDRFFHSAFDTELYRHQRYLPVYWHSHSFLEIVCVIEG